jgi:hypothetical protein
MDELMRALEARAASLGVEWLIASVGAEDAMRAMLKRRSGAREYATRLYRVTLPGMERADVEWRGQQVRPEAGLL